MCNIRTSITNVPVHLAHDTNVFVAVEQRVFVVLHARTAAAVRGLVGLEAGIGEDDNEPLRVLVIQRDGRVLFSYQLRKSRRGERLGACVWGHGVSCGFLAEKNTPSLRDAKAAGVAAASVSRMQTLVQCAHSSN